MKTIKFLFFFIVGYGVIVLITSLFIMSLSWGTKLNFFEKAFVYFVGGPLRLDKNLLNIIPNGLFWGLVVLVFRHILQLMNLIKF